MVLSSCYIWESVQKLMMLTLDSSHHSERCSHILSSRLLPCHNAETQWVIFWEKPTIRYGGKVGAPKSKAKSSRLWKWSLPVHCSLHLWLWEKAPLSPCLLLLQFQVAPPVLHQQAACWSNRRLSSDVASHFTHWVQETDSFTTLWPQCPGGSWDTLQNTGNILLQDNIGYNFVFCVHVVNMSRKPLKTTAAAVCNWGTADYYIIPNISRLQN